MRWVADKKRAYDMHCTLYVAVWEHFPEILRHVHFNPWNRSTEVLNNRNYYLSQREIGNCLRSMMTCSLSFTDIIVDSAF